MNEKNPAEFRDLTDNPWCNMCKEKHCLVSMDGTCSMIRKYLSAVKGEHEYEN